MALSDVSATWGCNRALASDVLSSASAAIISSTFGVASASPAIAPDMFCVKLQAVKHPSKANRTKLKQIIFFINRTLFNFYYQNDCLVELYTDTTQKSRNSASIEIFRYPSISANAAMIEVAGFLCLFYRCLLRCSKAVFSSSTLDAKHLPTRWGYAIIPPTKASDFV